MKKSLLAVLIAWLLIPSVSFANDWKHWYGYGHRVYHYRGYQRYSQNHHVYSYARHPSRRGYYRYPDGHYRYGFQWHRPYRHGYGR